ncbi:hypothetical protein ES705_38938 [subsurface metagenome]
MVVSYKVGESLAEWLPEYDWQYIFTATCRKPRTDALALMRDIAEVPGYERLFVACEPHRFGHNLHAHGLIATPEPATLPWRGFAYRPSEASDFWDKFNHRFGWSRVEAIKSMADVSTYCAKYVCKITDGDNYNFYGQDDLSWIK